MKLTKVVSAVAVTSISEIICSMNENGKIA